MHYLLLISAILWFAFIAPLKVTLATSLFLLLILVIVRFSISVVTGTQASYGETAKAISLSFIFLTIAVFTLVSFSYAPKGVSINLTGLAGYTVFAVTLAAYILGYKIGLGLSFGASTVIALFSSVVSTVAFMLIRSFL